MRAIAATGAVRDRDCDSDSESEVEEMVFRWLVVVDISGMMYAQWCELEDEEFARHYAGESNIYTFKDL